MKKFIISLFAFVLMAGHVASTALAQDNNSENNRLKMVLIGDSHAKKLGPALRYKMSNAGLGFDYKFGINTRAVNWIKSGKMKIWLRQINPDVVIVCFGTYEARRSTSVTNLVKQFRPFVNLVSENGQRKVIWIAPPKLSGVNFTNVREALKQIKGIEIVDLSDNEYGCKDGIHLTNAAYRVWAWDIWNEVKSE